MLCRDSCDVQADDTTQFTDSAHELPIVRQSVSMKITQGGILNSDRIEEFSTWLYASLGGYRPVRLYPLAFQVLL